MFLKSLEIQGFKSFPDKTLLTFGQGITAVVGPNGSGKSNISDAIRWVLGEISSKALRGTRMEDVIFGGAINRKPQGFAEVSLTIDNQGHELQFDGDEVKVTRRYYRSGESEYLLCGRDVRLKDIHELFMDTGLGRDGYSIIGQGRIDEIVGAKSEDRREIFEEAAGISKYRYRKEESERRLSVAEENLVRLRDILAELEARVGPLREQSEKAKIYIDLVGRKKTLEVGLWLYSLDRQRGTLREHENRLEYAQAQYNETEQKLEEAASQIEERYLEGQRRAAEIDELRRGAQELEETAAKRQAQADVLKNDIGHNEDNIARIAGEIDEVNHSGCESGERIAHVKSDIESKAKRAEELKAEIDRCESGVFEISKQNEGIGDALEQATVKLSALTVKQADARVENNGALSSLTHLKERAEAVDGDIAARAARIEEERCGLDDCAGRLKTFDEKTEELQNALKGYELKATSRREHIVRIDETMRSFSLQYDGKNQRAAMLENMERQLEGFSQSVRVVMREKERGNLSGIHAPVSKLIEVPREYAAAIETALGYAAQNIVVDNEENAKSAINMLKRCDGGRATFLPITSVHGNTLNERGLLQEQGIIGIASGLIKNDPCYDGIMASLLGRTVIAEDIDCAVEVARKYRYGFRIVTLDGQVVNAGGSMTGGSANKGTGLLSRAGEIAALREEAAKIKAQSEKFAAEKKALTEQLSALEASLGGIRGELQTAQEGRIRTEAEQHHHEETIISLEADIEALKAEKEQSAGRIDECEQAAEASLSKINALTIEIDAIQREVEALGGSRSELALRRERQAERLSSLRLESVACAKDIEAMEQEIGNIERLQQGGAEKISELQNQKSEFEQKIEQAQAEITALFAEGENLRSKANEKKDESAKMAAERDESERATAELRAGERALSEDKEKISKELARLEERRVAAQTEYDSLIAKLLDEYELTRSEAEKTVPKIEDPQGAQRSLNEVKNKIKALGSVNVDAIEEYREVSERYEFMKSQTDDVEKSKKELLELINGLTGQMREIFSKQFVEINRHFEKTFTELFGGGEAHLELSEPDDVLTSGIEIIVQPPGKIIKNLSMLSGGERAFVAIALYFAILKVRPSPFCVLDEIEAALDDANVARYAAYLRRMCGSTQFIIITHRRGTMDEADVLYGVTMQDEGVSKLLTLNVDELAERLGLK